MILRFSDKTITIATLIAYTLVALLMALVYLVSTKYNLPFKQITGDPALIFDAHPFTGIVSNIGVLFWCAASAICLFSSFLLRLKKNKEEALFLFCSGIITLILMVDDLFMVHDYFLYSLGFNEYFMYSIYLIIFTGYFLYFKNRLLKAKNILLLIFAFLFLGSSVGLDVVFESKGLQYFFEDGLKLFGIISWFLFYTKTCFDSSLNSVATLTS